jgi:hypothetical protein
MGAIEDMHRDRMLYLDLTSDPSSYATERDYANNILKQDFNPGVQNKGGSARSNKNFTAYQQQFLRATQFASAKASATRHLASSTGVGTGTGSTGNSNGSKEPNPLSNSQKKKEAAAKRKAAAEKATAAGAPKAPKEGARKAPDAGGD